MNHPGQIISTLDPSAKIASFLNQFIVSGGLDLQFRQVTAPAEPALSSTSSENASTAITLEFTGSDVPVLLARNGEVLHALEYMAARILGLESTQHDLISFDADNFKQNRVLELQAAADAAIQSVRATGRPYAFPPMSSQERRLLHLAIAPSGLATASKGENPRRYVILYPEGYVPTAPQEFQPNSGRSPAGSSVDRTHAIRKTFRRR